MNNNQGPATDSCSNKQFLFHYAPWSYLPAIVKAGVLRCSNAGAPCEPPLLWFSAHQYWEATATKLIRVNGRSRCLTFKEQLQILGCVRFAIPSKDTRLKDWKSSCEFAGTTRDMRRAMEKVGKKTGGSPCNWFSIGNDANIERLPFQVLLNRKWVDADATEMAQVWVEHQMADTP